MDSGRTPIEDAEAQLYRRIQELRARARGAEDAPAPPPEEERPAMPDLRTILARAESHVEELRTTAAGLEERLPGQVEEAIERAFDQHGDSRRLAEMAELMRSLSRQVEQVNRDLLAERLGRVEDLELIVDLVSTGFSALRDDVATMGAMVDRVGTNVGDVIEKLDQPLQVTVERPTRRGVVDLFSPTVATEPDDPGPDATA